MQVLLKTKRREARREARRERRREVRAAKKEKRVKDKELQRKRVHEAAARCVRPQPSTPDPLLPPRVHSRALKLDGIKTYSIVRLEALIADGEKALLEESFPLLESLELEEALAKMRQILETKRQERRVQREVRAKESEQRVKDKELQRKRIHEAAARRECKASNLELSLLLSGH
jgi:hypothetical protein